MPSSGIRESLIDVCIVTKNGRLPTGLGFVPVSHVIIEQSHPLGLARKRAISQVTTTWFAFLDDDVRVSQNWWHELSKYMNNGVGAIQGDVQNVGLGTFDSVLARSGTIPRSLKIGERGMTHNVLIRADLVRDWQPSTPKLEAWEDWEITQHILRKGFTWLVVPTTAQHVISWVRVAESAFWGGKWCAQIQKPSMPERVRCIYALIMTAFRYVWQRNVRGFVYQLWFTLFMSMGVLFSAPLLGATRVTAR